ncbi:hypothetical protein EAF04_007985 [Stromatinia cepivora]|nr:hypothetical protein EAF04_007985 [Stromatinia cepivora]
MPPQLTRVSVSSLPADQRTCAICQETLGGLEGGEPVKTQCNHAFDRDCIERWLDGDHTTCPICREEIRNTGGGGLRDRLRNISRSVRRARERAVEEREQMVQAQADYGDANDGDSDDESPWMEYEPMPPSSPGNFNTPRPAPRNYSPPRRNYSPPRRNYPPPLRRSYSTPPQRNYSPPRHRYQESRSPTSGSDMQRASMNYSSTLNDLKRLDYDIMTQAQSSYHANERHHAAERQIQLAFTQLQAAVQSRDRYTIEHALAMQDSVTPLLDQAYVAVEREGLLLAGMMAERAEADERLTQARGYFARVRELYMVKVRESLDGD